MCLSYLKDLAAIFQSVATGIGVLAAGGYFVYKLLSGYEIVNVRLTLDAKRTHLPDGQTDLLVVKCVVAKGDRGSVALNDAQARFTQGSSVVTRQLVGIERLSYDAALDDPYARKLIAWDRQSKSSSFLKLAPGEETCFSCLTNVSRTQPCVIEVALIGKRTGGSNYGQWRASCISTPEA